MFNDEGRKCGSEFCAIEVDTVLPTDSRRVAECGINLGIVIQESVEHKCEEEHC